MDLDHTFIPDFRWAEDPEVGEIRDPDVVSIRLRHYHQHLWSHRPLTGRPGGPILDLAPQEDGLIDRGATAGMLGLAQGVYLTSDRMPTWWRWTRTAKVRADAGLTERITAANPVLDNMGGIILWPGRTLGGQTLNGSKGFLGQIGDRLDLTLECIRLGFLGSFDYSLNPLGPVLARNWQFFSLFGDFQSYIRFWLLDDLVSDDMSRVRFLMEGDIDEYDFLTRRAVPRTVGEYDTYLESAQRFVVSRNRRMADVWATLALG